MKTEKKLEFFLLLYYPTLISQFKPEWIRNPITGKMLSFDFCIQEYNIIIELDGDHHFKINTRIGTDYNQNRYRDIYKMMKAIENNYSIIRLYQPDVWLDKYNWREKLLFNIAYFNTYNLKKEILYMNYTDLYSQHIEDFNDYNINKIVKSLETYDNYMSNLKRCQHCGERSQINFYKYDTNICKKCEDDIAFTNLFNKIYLK